MCDPTNLSAILDHLKNRLRKLENTRRNFDWVEHPAMAGQLDSEIYQCKEDIAEVELEIEEKESK